MRRLSLYIFILCLAAGTSQALAQTAKDEARLKENLQKYFSKYKPKGTRLTEQPRLTGCQVDNKARTLVITADEYFAAQEFTPEITAHIYKKIKGELPKVYRDYMLTVMTNGMTIDELIPNRLSKNADKSRLWGNINYDGAPWVKNISQPHKVTHGLQGRHLSLWASHGRFYPYARFPAQGSVSERLCCYSEIGCLRCGGSSC